MSRARSSLRKIQKKRALMPPIPGKGILSVDNAWRQGLIDVDLKTGIARPLYENVRHQTVIRDGATIGLITWGSVDLSKVDPS